MVDITKLGWFGVCSLGTLLSATPAWSDARSIATSSGELGQAPVQDQIQMHKALAKLHVDAANCLKSKVPMDECNQRMKAGCPPGLVNECTSVDRADLEKHRMTHDMAGTISQPKAPTSAKSQNKSAPK
jgi:hypothetical protein